MVAVAHLHRDGVPPGIGAAVHAAWHLPVRGADALGATVDARRTRGLECRVRPQPLRCVSTRLLGVLAAPAGGEVRSISLVQAVATG